MTQVSTRTRVGWLDLLEWLDGQGFSIEEMQHAHGRAAVGVVSLAADRRLLGGALLKRTEALELSDLSPDDFDESVIAVGFVPVDGAPDGEIGFTTADAMMFAALGLFSAMFSHDEAMAIVRVVGSSGRRSPGSPRRRCRCFCRTSSRHM